MLPSSWYVLFVGWNFGWQPDREKTNQVQSDPGASALFASADGYVMMRSVIQKLIVFFFTAVSPSEGTYVHLEIWSLAF